jgi:two-component system response regulator RegA
MSAPGPSSPPVATAPAARFGLLVDDDALYLRALQRALHKRGIASATARTADEALRLATDETLDFALVDLRLGSQSGLDLIEPLRRACPRMRIVLLSGYASIATAVEAIKRGADDCLPKPTTAEMIVRALSDQPELPPEPSATMIPLDRLEWEHIHRALAESNGNVSAAARLLGMHRRSLQRKLAKRPGPERRPTGASEE